mgnify:CR=1 FL=1
MIATLQSKRLSIAPLSASDLAFYVDLYSDAQTMACIGQPLSTMAAERSFVVALRCNQMLTARRQTWILSNPEGFKIGILALIGGLADMRLETAEVGAMIIPAQQNRGYAAEAIATLAAHAFANLGVCRLVTRHSPANQLANGLMCKLGFERLPDGAGPQSTRWQLLGPQ